MTKISLGMIALMIAGFLAIHGIATLNVGMIICAVLITSAVVYMDGIASLPDDIGDSKGYSVHTPRTLTTTTDIR